MPLEDKYAQLLSIGDRAELSFTSSQILRKAYDTEYAAENKGHEQILTQNLTLFDDSVCRSDVIQAAKDACIHEDIFQLEKGYDSEVSEGGLNFSGGQRQRLEIARALANNPSLLYWTRQLPRSTL